MTDHNKLAAARRLIRNNPDAARQLDYVDAVADVDFAAEARVYAARDRAYGVRHGGPTAEPPPLPPGMSYAEKEQARARIQEAAIRGMSTTVGTAAAAIPGPPLVIARPGGVPLPGQSPQNTIPRSHELLGSRYDKVE